MGRRRPSRASTGRILAHPGAVLVAGIAGRQGRWRLHVYLGLADGRAWTPRARRRWRLHVYLGLASCPSLDSARSQAVAGRGWAPGPRVSFGPRCPLVQGAPSDRWPRAGGGGAGKRGPAAGAGPPAGVYRPGRLVSGNTDGIISHRRRRNNSTDGIIGASAKKDGAGRNNSRKSA